MHFILYGGPFIGRRGYGLTEKQFTFQKDLIK
jgi:hypothetical protein